MNIECKKRKYLLTSFCTERILDVACWCRWHCWWHWTTPRSSLPDHPCSDLGAETRNCVQETDLTVQEVICNIHRVNTSFAVRAMGAFIPFLFLFMTNIDSRTKDQGTVTLYKERTEGEWEGHLALHIRISSNALNRSRWLYLAVALGGDIWRPGLRFNSSSGGFDWLISVWSLVCVMLGAEDVMVTIIL